MSVIDQVRKADSLQLSDITYQLNSPLGSQNGFAAGFCKVKDGPLAFTLTSEDLNLPVSGLKFPFVGTPDTAASTITWRVDQALSQWESGAHITRVHGSITTMVGDTDPTIATTCDGSSERLFRTSLIAAGSNAITVETSLGDAHARNIMLGAFAGEVLPPVYFDIGLSAASWHDDGCGQQFQLINTEVVFTAWPEHLRIVGALQSISFDWTVANGPATIQGRSDGQSINLSLTGAGVVTLIVKIALTTTVDSGVKERHFTFVVFDERGVELMRTLCNLRRNFSRLPNAVARGVGPGFTLGGRRYIDPLWDPVKSTFDPASIRRLRSQLDHLNTIGERLQRQLEAIGEAPGLDFAAILVPRERR